MSKGWPSMLRAREMAGAAALPPFRPPTASSGTLVLDESLTTHAIPGGLLSGLQDQRIHYLDLGGVQAASLLDFGGAESMWGGLTKLYASRCGLTSLDGIARLTSVRFLYIDHNQLSAEQLQRLCAELPAGRLEALDLSGNPGGEDAEVLEALLASGVLACCQFFNGRRLRDG